VPRLEIATLGPPEIRLEGVPLTGLASNKVRALLYHLGVDRNRTPGRVYGRRDDRTHRDDTAIRFASFHLWEGGD
jgi:hypothetical protein